MIINCSACLDIYALVLQHSNDTVLVVLITLNPLFEMPNFDE
jgi:hypothetical protein